MEIKFHTNIGEIMKNKTDDYLRKMQDIDAHYLNKIDRIKKEWNEKLMGYWLLIDIEKEKLIKEQGKEQGVA